MAMGEFEAIYRFFDFPKTGAWTHGGIGDDCAIVEIGSLRLAMTLDQMAITTHFLENVNPYTCGQKALAVNMSDLAASGSTPRAFFLGLGLSSMNETWLEGFSRGLKEAALAYGCDLMGGDTTKTPVVNGTPSPNSIAIMAIGELEGEAPALTRAGARPGDDIWVSHYPGEAYAALMLRWGKWTLPEGLNPARLYARMDTPTARVALGQKLRGIASACADISDGLCQDLGHILERSHVSATIDIENLPISPDLARFGKDKAREAVLRGGDDYELIFTAPSDKRDAIVKIGHALNLTLSRLGKIERSREGELLHLRENLRTWTGHTQGFDHFRDAT